MDNNKKQKIKDKIYSDTKHKLHQNDLIYQIFQHKNSIADLEAIKQKQSKLSNKNNRQYLINLMTDTSK
jgi:hypothetical protein